MKPRARFTRCCSPPENVAGGNAVQPARNVQPQQQHRRRLLARLVRRDAAADQRLGHDVQRRHARHHAQELADIAEGVAGAPPGSCADRRSRCRPSRRDGGPGSARCRRGSCRTGCASGWTCRRRTARQHDALAGLQFEIDAAKHRHAHAALQMQREALWRAPRCAASHRSDARSCLQHRTDQQLRVGMLRIVEHLVGQSGLHHAPALHHRDAMRRAAAPPRCHASPAPRRCPAAPPASGSGRAAAPAPKHPARRSARP